MRAEVGPQPPEAPHADGPPPSAEALANQVSPHSLEFALLRLAVRTGDASVLACAQAIIQAKAETTAAIAESWAKSIEENAKLNKQAAVTAALLKAIVRREESARPRPCAQELHVADPRAPESQRPSPLGAQPKSGIALRTIHRPTGA
jgi:hypothetical protein